MSRGGGMSSTPETKMPTVALIFPPHVTTNFGNYFPSTAVLAAYLSTRGITAKQIDLNEDFMDYLLRPEHLRKVSTGITLDGREISLAAMEAVAARILGRAGNLLFDPQGRHLSIETPNSPLHLLTILAEPYRLDLAVHEFASEAFHAGATACMYRDFFLESKVLKELPASIHTIGISVPMGPQLGPALILARLLKQLYVDTTIVMGGPTFSLMAKEALTYLLEQEKCIDAVVRFDGENPFLSLVSQKASGKWYPQLVAGVSSHVGDKVIHRPPSPGLHLNELPYGEYDPQLMARLADPEIGIVQARGCYWGKCAYCDFIELYEGSPRYRTRSPGQVVEEMELPFAPSWSAPFLINYRVLTRSLRGKDEPPYS